VQAIYTPAPYQDSAEYGRLILKDGSTATIRLATTHDGPALTAFFHRLSPQSRQHRFFSFAEPSTEFVQSLCDSSNPRQKLTFVVTRATSGQETIVAAGSYFARDEKSAEVAMAVDDQLQGRGIGAHLLERLALLAARAGLTRFWAITHFDNRAMIEVFRHSGFPVTEKLESGYLELDFSVLRPNPASSSRRCGTAS
jgi:RimJ/RimL family protein N-acetyltransferase